MNTFSGKRLTSALQDRTVHGASGRERSAGSVHSRHSWARIAVESFGLGSEVYSEVYGGIPVSRFNGFGKNFTFLCVQLRLEFNKFHHRAKAKYKIKRDFSG